MLNKSACADLAAAGLRQATTETHSLVLEMRKHRRELIYWVLGSYFGSMVLAGALIALAFKGMVYLFYLDGKLG